MNADPSQIDDGRIGSTDAAQLLGVTEGRMRQLARRGDFGAQKRGREWTFDRSLIEQRITNMGHETLASLQHAGTDQAAEADSLRFERRLLLAEIAAGEHQLEITNLQATLRERDATIAVLYNKVSELERRLGASAKAITELAQSLAANTDDA